MTKSDAQIDHFSRVSKREVSRAIEQSRRQIAASDDMLNKMPRQQVIHHTDQLQHFADLVTKKLGRMVFVWNPALPLPVMMAETNSIQ